MTKRQLATRRHSGRQDQFKAGPKRLADAKVLQAQRRWRGAMYLAGYSIECKLKALLMEKYELSTLEDLESRLSKKLKKPVQAFTHNFEILLDLANLTKRLRHMSPASEDVMVAYRRCVNWTPSWRYDPDDGTEADCVRFMDAVRVFGKFIDGNM